MANWLIGVITGVRLHDYGCTLKVMRRDVVRGLRLYGEMHRFIPALVDDLGARIVEVPVHHRPRVAGRVEVRDVAHRARAARPDHGEVPVELLDAADPRLRRHRPGVRPSSGC